MVNIRKARLKELDDLVAIWKRFMEQQKGMGREMGEDRLQPLKDNAPEIVRNYFQRSIRSRNGFLLVLEDNGEIVGYMLSRIEKNIPVFKEDRIGYLSDVYLEGPYRGKGHSSRMWKRTLDWFRSKSIKELSIRVLNCNPVAHSIYDTWGFKDLLIEMRLELKF